MLVITGKNSDIVRLHLELERRISIIQTLHEETKLDSKFISEIVSAIIYEKLRINSYNVEVLIQDLNSENKIFYFVDNYGNLSNYRMFVGGLAATFCLGIVDKYINKELKEEDMFKVMEECLNVLRNKSIIGGECKMLVERNGVIEEKIIK